MSFDLLFGFIFGFFFGFTICVFNINISNKKTKKRSTDPANWWKYGKDPFDYTSFDD